jgi:type 1 glutamine amidotransferase
MPRFVARRAHNPTMRGALLLAIGIFAGGCGADSTQPGPTPGQSPVRVLMVTTTAGFRHDSIPTARDTMASLANQNGFTVTATEDLSAISSTTLAGYDVLFFALTSGELPLNTDQKAALLAFVSGGKGFIGAHSATDTLHDWPEYGRLVGASFKDHPWTLSATVVVEDQSHETAAGLGDRFNIVEEFYAFTDNPRPRVHVLLRLDAASVGASGDYPLAWTSSYGSGRVYYNALGHFAETWRDPRFQGQITAAIRWAGARH